MTGLGKIVDFILHVNLHIPDLTERFGPWIYALMFLVIFCETGLVVTPFLPGDSLLFALGAFAAVPEGLNLGLLLVLLSVAAVLGDTVNYATGAALSARLLRGDKLRFINRRHLDRTHDFFERYGAKTIILARFAPIVRTFAPFVAGMGRMTYRRFMAYNIVGGLVWVWLFLLLGYFFGNIEVVQKNFTLVILAIIVISFVPPVVEFIRERRRNHGEGDGDRALQPTGSADSTPHNRA